MGELAESVDRSLVESENGNGEVFRTLKGSKYPDVPDEQINLLIGYCRAQRLDPLADVAHIVGYNQKNKKTDRYEKVYKIIPGIAKFRVHASRSGLYMGISEPEFGPIIEEKIGTATVRYPEYCLIKVKKLVDGKIAEFVAKEYWIENYARKSATDPTPNDMWLKRQRGQLAKCTEAQGLRKSFPEITGGEVTFEEIQGKSFQHVIQEEGYYAGNVVDRIKNKKKAPLSIISHEEAKEVADCIEDVLAQDFCSGIQDLDIKNPSVEGEIYALFEDLRNANDAVKKRVDEFISKQENADLSDKKIKQIIKNIMLTFPELRRQLSKPQTDLLDSIT